MYEEKVVSSRPDRELFKKLVTPGDYNIVPFDDSRCKITISDVSCSKHGEKYEIGAESHFFSSKFNGNILIGDCDGFIDKDFELVLQRMCCGETSDVRMVYRNSNNELVKEIRCRVEMKEVTEEQLISDWGWERLYDAALYHKVPSHFSFFSFFLSTAFNFLMCSSKPLTTFLLISQHSL